MDKKKYIGKMVKVTGSKSIPSKFGVPIIGACFLVTEESYGDKVTIELKPKIDGKGSLSHTVSITEIELVEG